MSFGYLYERSWDILFQLFLKRSIQKIKYGLAGFLTKVPGQVISAAIGRRKTSLDGDTCDENTDMTMTGNSFSAQGSRCYEAKNERNYLDRTEAFLLC